MEDIRCTQCGKLLAKKAMVRYIEIKCDRCGAVNVIDDRNLTTVVKSSIMGMVRTRTP